MAYATEPLLLDSTGIRIAQAIEALEGGGGGASSEAIAYVETTTTATRNYAVGDYLMLDGILYIVVTAITSGDTILIESCKSVSYKTETTTTATRDYAVGDYIFISPTYYEVTAAITSGDTIAVGTNVTALTLQTESTTTATHSYNVDDLFLLDTTLVKAVRKINVGDTIYTESTRNVADTKVGFELNKRQEKPLVTTTTLLAAGWTDGVYSLEGTYPDAEYDIEVGLNSETANSGHATQWANACLGDCYTGNKLVVSKIGEVPTSNIPVIIWATKK